MLFKIDKNKIIIIFTPVYTYTYLLGIALLTRVKQMVNEF